MMLAAGLQYQKPKLDEALKYVTRRTCAVDVGAHCGLWAKQLKDVFERVVAFEPLHAHIAHLRINAPGVDFYPVALGDAERLCDIETREGFSGQSRIIPGVRYRMHMLDQYELKPDFIKIDCEGYELNVLMGAVETLKSKPVVIIEQKFNKDALAFLVALGYEIKAEIAGDYIAA